MHRETGLHHRLDTTTREMLYLYLPTLPSVQSATFLSDGVASKSSSSEECPRIFESAGKSLVKRSRHDDGAQHAQCRSNMFDVRLRKRAEARSSAGLQERAVSTCLATKVLAVSGDDLDRHRRTKAGLPEYHLGCSPKRNRFRTVMVPASQRKWARRGW